MIVDQPKQGCKGEFGPTKAPDTPSLSSQFYKLPCWLASRGDVVASDKLVYAIIADFISRNVIGWPGIRRIARDAGLNPGTVVEAVSRLERAGLLAVTRGGMNKSNLYRLGAEGACGETERAKKPNVRKTRTCEETERAEKPIVGVRKTHTPACGKSVQNQTDLLNQTQSTSRQGRRDEHADAFAVAYQQHFGSAYAWQDGDFPQLARWRKSYPDVTPEAFAAVALWHWQQGQYGSSNAATIRGLASNWQTLQAKPAAEAKRSATGGNGKLHPATAAAGADYSAVGRRHEP